MKTLKILYSKALELDDVVGISIGTRTDSVTEEILDYLMELNQEKEVWVEYGVQSISDKTLIRINRGHNVDNMYKWINKTKNRGLKVCTHLVFGLPNETKEMMIESVKKMIELKIDSIKIHPLYVVKNTALAVEFRQGTFIPISKEEYISTVVGALKIIPKNIIIQRITAGTNDATLLAPSWCKNKHVQMNDLRVALKKEKINY